MKQRAIRRMLPIDGDDYKEYSWWSPGVHIPNGDMFGVEFHEGVYGDRFSSWCI